MYLPLSKGQTCNEPEIDDSMQQVKTPLVAETGSMKTTEIVLPHSRLNLPSLFDQTITNLH